MDALTIHEAAETTGWSPRMLRYIERVGLVDPARSASGYRLYGAAELQRLRTLRELLERFEHRPRRRRLRRCACAATPELRDAVDDWLEAEPSRPEDVPAARLAALGAGQARALLAAAAELPIPTPHATETA